MVKTILTTGDSTQLVEPFLPGLKDRILYHSYGKVIPDLSDTSYSYWMAGAYALKLRLISRAPYLSSPGNKWLPSVPKDFLGRDIGVGDLQDLRSTGLEEVWVKPAEAKVNAFPAGLRKIEDLIELFIRNNYSQNLVLHWTKTVLDFNYEHRFFVVNNQIVTGSPYRVDNQGYSVDIDYSKYSDASYFANDVLSGVESPMAFVLDVGLDQVSKRWRVVEANRVWSSGIYGCDPAAVLDALPYSLWGDVKWNWSPDNELLKMAKKWSPLMVRDLKYVDKGYVTVTS